MLLAGISINLIAKWKNCMKKETNLCNNNAFNWDPNRSMNARETILVYLAWINKPLIIMFEEIRFSDRAH